MSMIDLATRIQSLGIGFPALLVVLKATLILAIARLLLLAVPRLSAATKHLGITLALCSVLALPIIALSLPTWHVAVLPNQTTPQKTTAATPAASTQSQAKTIGATGDDDEVLPQGTVDTAITVARAAHVVPESKLNAVTRAFNTVKESWQGFLIIGVVSVSIALLLRIVAGVIGVGIVARRSTEITDDVALRELDRACDHLQLNREVHLLRSDNVTVPVVWGLAKPILLLPASSAEWTAERLRVVMLHELAHVKRLDGLTLLVTKAAVALFWFHPLMWSLERIARAECERACDDLVLETGTKASDYAEHLLSIAKALPRVDPFRSVTLAMSRRSQLEGRLLSILQPHVRRGNFSLKAVGMVAAVALFVIVPLASVRLVAAPQPSSSHITVVADKSDAKPALLDLDKLIDTSDVLLARYDKLTGHAAPKSGKEWYQRAYELHGDEHFQEAIESFKQAISHGYRIEDSMYNIACGYAQLGDAVNSVKWLRDAINAGYDNYGHIESDSDFDPIREDALFKQVLNEAPAYEREKKEREADSASRRYEMLKSVPNADGSSWFQLGYELLPARRYDESIDAFKHALEKGYKPSTTMYNIACGYARKGDKASALDWLQRAVNEGFDSYDKFEDDSDLDNVRNDPRFAQLKQMAADLRLQPGDGVWGMAKKMFGDEGDWVDALPHFRAMTQKYPNLGRSWFNLGYAALNAGQNQESINAFKKALDLQYRPSTVMYNIACGYARANQNDAAMDWLQRARAAGFQLSNYIDNDSDLNSLRSDPRFRQLRREVRAEKESKED